MTTDKQGNKYWKENLSNFHREDGPAIEFSDGDKHWYVHGLRHREDGPAAEFADGTKGWIINGKLHREDGPAIIHADGTLEWWLNGEVLSYCQWMGKRFPFFLSAINTCKTLKSKPVIFIL